jgi:hypothetical protein
MVLPVNRIDLVSHRDRVMKLSTLRGWSLRGFFATQEAKTSRKQHRLHSLRTVFIVIDVLDGKILHALQLSPRVSFRRIAEVVDAPEQAVARRYRNLHRGGVVRVIGLVNPQVHGECQWVVRVHAKPDDVPRLAEALVRRREGPTPTSCRAGPNWFASFEHHSARRKTVFCNAFRELQPCSAWKSI